MFWVRNSEQELEIPAMTDLDRYEIRLEIRTTTESLPFFIKVIHVLWSLLIQS